jgi:hypothetical protein
LYQVPWYDEFSFVALTNFPLHLSRNLKLMTFFCYHHERKRKSSLAVASSATDFAPDSRSFPNDLRFDSQNWLTIVVGPLSDSHLNREKEDADNDSRNQDERETKEVHKRL